MDLPPTIAPTRVWWECGGFTGFTFQMQIWRKVTNEITRTCIHISCGFIPISIILNSDHSETIRVDLNGHTDPNPQVCPLWDNNLLGGIERKAGYITNVRNSCDRLDD